MVRDMAVATTTASCPAAATVAKIAVVRALSLIPSTFSTPRPTRATTVTVITNGTTDGRTIARYSIPDSALIAAVR